MDLILLYLRRNKAPAAIANNAPMVTPTPIPTFAPALSPEGDAVGEATCVAITVCTAVTVGGVASLETLPRTADAVELLEGVFVGELLGVDVVVLLLEVVNAAELLVVELLVAAVEKVCGSPLVEVMSILPACRLETPASIELRSKWPSSGQETILLALSANDQT